MNIKATIKTVETFTKKNSPTILTVLNVIGLATTIYSSYKAGIKSASILEDRRIELNHAKENIRRDERYRNMLEEEALKQYRKDVNKQAAKMLVPILIPPIVAATGSAAAGIASNVINQNRLVKLGTALAISETAYKELSEKTTELLGEKKLQSIKDAITKDKMDEAGPAPNLQTRYMTFEGEKPELCFDAFSKRYFYATPKQLDKAIATLGHSCYIGTDVCLNEFYDEFSDLDRLEPAGKDYGWTANDLFGDGELPIRLSSFLTNDGRPCIIVGTDSAKMI